MARAQPNAWNHDFLVGNPQDQQHWGRCSMASRRRRIAAVWVETSTPLGFGHALNEVDSLVEIHGPKLASSVFLARQRAGQAPGAPQAKGKPEARQP